MPKIAFDLIVAAWKIVELESEQLQLAPAQGDEREHWLYGVKSCAQERHTAVATSELEVDLLDPKPVPERDARQLYAAELSDHPAILGDLDAGGAQDGVELVLERANLSTRERMVVRPWLSGDDVREIASQLVMRPQAVALVLANARKRLEDVRSWSRPRRLLAPGQPI